MITYSFKLGRINKSELKDGLNEAMQVPLVKAAKRVQQAIRKSMRKAPRPGVPSRPGYPPHVQTGNLRSDISVFRRKLSDGRYSVSVGFSRKAWYGIIHEHGGQYHPARPFIRPAWNKEKYRLKHLFRNLPLAHTGAIRRINSRSIRRVTR